MTINNEQSLETTLAFIIKLGGVASFCAYSCFVQHIIQGQYWPWDIQMAD